MVTTHEERKYSWTKVRGSKYGRWLDSISMTDRRGQEAIDRHCHMSNWNLEEIDPIFAGLISKTLSDSQGLYVLDVACGSNSRLVRDLRKKFASGGHHIFGVDIYQNEPFYDYEEAVAVIGLDSALPFRTDSIDLLITHAFLYNVYKHDGKCELPPRVRTYSEMFRVLKKGGIALIDDAHLIREGLVGEISTHIGARLEVMQGHPYDGECGKFIYARKSE